jgi:hypothetical protein
MALLTPSERAQLHEIWLLALVMLVLTAAAAVAACLRHVWRPPARCQKSKVGLLRVAQDVT